MPKEYLSPLRYPGAKRKLAPHIKKLIQDYDYTDRVFVEPCCGGASVSLYLLNQNIVSSVVLADLDPWIASFWHMLFFETETLIEDIRKVEVTVKTWETFRHNRPTTIREQALHCFFFNRTCYSGILHGGIIGGKNQTSKYKIDCRFNKIELIDRIRRTANKFSGKILEVRTASVFDIIAQEKLEKHKGYIFYIDPPYVAIGQKLYPFNFRTEQHRSLKTALENFQEPWILSYHDHHLIKNLYLEDENLQHIALDVKWVADEPKIGTELLISNFPHIKSICASKQIEDERHIKETIALKRDDILFTNMGMNIQQTYGGYTPSK